MELNLVTSVELARRYQAGKTATMPTVRCSVFHPTEPHLFVSADDEVYSTFLHYMFRTSLTVYELLKQEKIPPRVKSSPLAIHQLGLLV